MKYLLESYGYIVCVAANGKEAVKLAQEFHPNLILMDISMPVMDGLTATKIIRASTIIAQIPIIAITAFSDNYKETALQAGCNHFITKPLDLDTLEAVIETYLAH